MRCIWMGCLAAAIAVFAWGCAGSDTGITSAVKMKMAADEVVKAYQIDIDTRERVVTLSGSVETQEARERAVRLARSTDGVASVVDNLSVGSGPTAATGAHDRVPEPRGTGQVEAAARDAGRAIDHQIEAARRGASDAAGTAGAVMSDAALTAAVKTRFLADPDISGLKIDVDTTDGVVTLRGGLKSNAERQRALSVARETKGVREVVDRLRVAQ
jgi:hyperosmotically inducible periplasmic protein